MYKSILYIVLFVATIISAQAQQGIIKGRVSDAVNNEAIPFVNVVIQGTTTGTTTDIDGNYELTELQPGLYNIQFSYLGYTDVVRYEIQVTNSLPATVDVGLEPTDQKLDVVEVVASPFERNIESPLSVQTIGVNEIQRNPGGNRDISKAIQSLPGVSSTVSFRNDIIIRGGAPNENRFYLDGIEVPNINHFATQGASGGPVGMINVDFIREVEFYSGAFPANRGNTLSSILEFKQIDGRDDRIGFRFTLGASEAGISLQGPLGKKKRSTFIFSARQSYLQLLFKAIGLPFLPTYNDVQFKNVVKINDKNDLTIIGLGAYDVNRLNLDRNDTEEQRYVLGYLPENIQWNYTIGAKYRRYLPKGYMILVASRNHLNNRAFKYQNNDDSTEDNLILDYRSEEIENKLRFEHTSRVKGFKINYGVNYEFAQYNNRTFNRAVVPNLGVVTVDFSSAFNMNKYGFFAQVSRSVLKDRISLSLGIRADGNDYSDDMANLFKQFSPRASVSFALTDFLRLNANGGLYYQLPPYTVLGYTDNNGRLVNRDNDITYIRNAQAVAGLEFLTKKNSRITVESFYKHYDQYPFLTNDSISLANLGGDFGVIGNEPATSTSVGRAYGVEFLFQQKLFKGFYGLVTYTFVRSEFKDKNGEYIPSSWDNRHIVVVTAGKKFKKNWELGIRWRFYGGSPYTPYDVALSSRKEVWDVTGRGLPNYNLLNSQRLEPAHQLDLRVDKKYFFKKWDINFYLDIQNLYYFRAKGAPDLLVVEDENGNPVEDPNDPTRYQTKLIENTVSTILPSIGIVITY